ncbi:MAG: TolB family protein [Prevotella sp.]
MNTRHLILVGLIVLFTGCAGKREAAESVDALPKIFPDYCDVTIPSNIAPLNFMMEDVEHIQARFCLEGEELATVCGSEGVVDIPIGEWRNMTRKAAGKRLNVEVSAWNKEKPDGVRYKAFDIAVAIDTIDPYIAYRLIEPGYEAWRQMGIYERDMSSFEEYEIVSNKTTKSACINCHHFDRRSSRRMMFHARGENGGTIFLENGKTRKVKPEKSAVYPAWHPEGRYIAFASNVTRQSFYGQGRQPIEVYDRSSDLIIYDTQTDRIVTDSRFNNDEKMETFPSWSPNGKWLYFCSATSKDMPDERKDLHYNIVRVAFDSKSCSFGEKIDTVYNAMHDGGSASFPRVSPDGRFLCFTLSEYGTFPIWHNEADLVMLDMTEGKPVDVSIWNDRDNTESFHSWSANGRWMLFSSRRLDGRYTRLYIGYFGSDGKACKPFLLPQKDPRLNTLRLKSFNVPEFVDGKIEMPESTVELFKCPDKLIQ